MGISKSEEFTVRDNRVADIAKALSHPARVAILRLLARRRSCICGDIVDELPLSQSTVSQHLKELKAARLIKGEIDGPRVCYCIDGKVWNSMQGVMNTFFADYHAADESCC